MRAGRVLNHRGPAHVVHRPSYPCEAQAGLARDVAQGQIGHAAGRGEGADRRLRMAALDRSSRPLARRATKLLNAIRVHRTTSTAIAEVSAARAEGMRALDGDVARVERIRLALLDAVPLETFQVELGHGGI